MGSHLNSESLARDNGSIDPVNQSYHRISRCRSVTVDCNKKLMGNNNFLKCDLLTFSYY